ncbi:MAG: VanW family protein [Patescibacteria group bacterium]|nr:VanW family protein [Patescibacteria group bacterium]
MKIRNITLYGAASVFLFVIALISVKPAFACDESDFLFNKELQNLLSRSIVLEQEKDKTIIEVKDYVSWQPDLKIKSGYISEIENIYRCNENAKEFILCEITLPLEYTNHPKKGAKVSVNNEKIKQHLTELSENIKREPINGRFRISEDGELSVLERSRSGRALNIDKTAITIRSAIMDVKKSRIPLIIEEVKPEISTKNIGSIGIKDHLGHGESNFRGSPRNRVYNIKLSTEKFNGIILKPKEEFSFASILGPVDGKRGYKKELVIKKDETIPEFGGGICQVSTTMFRVALDAGFKITKRQNHAYPVQYYNPQGMDATVYLPSPDLRFINNTSGFVLIQASINGTKLSFDAYGTSDGREVEIKGPRVTARTPGGGLKTILYQNVKNKNGSYIIKDIFKSFYDSPDKYHKPKFTTKPKDWSNKQWKEYKQQHNL